MIKCMSRLVQLDSRWILWERGYSLYLRPTMVATTRVLGVMATSNAMLFTITSPCGPYYRTGFNAVALLAQTEAVRAWPGGIGDCKAGGNYAPTIQVQMDASKLGYQQSLWLFNGEGEDEVTEVGTMNCFIFWRNRDGGTL